MRTHGFKTGADGVERASVSIKVTIERSVYETLKKHLRKTEKKTVTAHFASMCQAMIDAVAETEKNRTATNPIE